MRLADAPLSQSSPDTLQQNDESQQQASSPWTAVNVSDTERMVSIAAGGLLAYATIRRPGPIPEEQRRHHEPCTSCPITAPPLRQVGVGSSR